MLRRAPVRSPLLRLPTLAAVLGFVSLVSAVAGMPLLAPSSARAQAGATAEDPRVRARELYTRGRQEFDAGRFEQAQQAFQGAYDAVPNPVVLLGVASAQERRGLRTDAARTLRRYLRERADAPDRAQIEQRITELDPSGVTAEPVSAAPGSIRVAGAPEGAAIALDGQATGRIVPAELAAPAGEHVITVSAEGYLPGEFTVTVTSGAASEVAVELATVASEDVAVGEDVPPEGEEAPPDVPMEAPPSVGTWVTTGLAAAGLVTGTVFGFLALSAQSDFDSTPTESIADNGETYALVADISFGVALAMGVTAIVLFATDRPSAPADAPAASRDQDDGPRVTFAPIASPTAGGAALRVEF